ISTGANSDDQPFRTSGQNGALVGNTLYDVFNRPSRLEYGATLGKKAYKSLECDEHTGRHRGASRPNQDHAATLSIRRLPCVIDRLVFHPP
ncbi:hypothetical protein, partial [Streptomyces sp. NPDC001933]|uniref:hypothetical protein n=1 Tax=Streptomyces sp. NPDC001933 TaxID=3364626 RepID=UPI0036917090